MTKEKEFSLFPCIPLENFQCHRFLKKKKGTVMWTNCAALIGMWFLWVPVTEHEETDEGDARNKREREANFIQQHRKGKPLSSRIDATRAPCIDVIAIERVAAMAALNFLCATF